MSLRALLPLLAAPLLLSHCTSAEDDGFGGGGKSGMTGGEAGTAGAGSASGFGGRSDGGRTTGGAGGAGQATGGSITAGAGAGGGAGTAGTSSGGLGGGAGAPEGGQGGMARGGNGGASGAAGRGQGGMAGNSGGAGGRAGAGAGGMSGSGGRAGAAGSAGAGGAGGAGGTGSGFSCNPACGTGMMCCPNSALTTSCIPQTTAGCLAPDLTISGSRAQQTVTVEYRNFQSNHCALAEQCIAASGRRRLLRFETFTPNIGTADMRLGVPQTSNPVFEYSACHDHFHFKGYAEYDLLDMSGAVVASGHKQAFCLLDTERYVMNDNTVRRTPQFDCGNQGISRGWGDSYTPDLDCQWVDVTDVAPGQYRLRIRINQARVLLELRYDNNEVLVPVTIP